MEATIEETIRHISFLARHLSGCEYRHVVAVFMLELGVSTRGAGFAYLKQAILLQHEDPTQLYTKHIYPEIAKRFGPHANKCQVERAIGLQIKRSWLNRNNKIWARYFPPDENGQVPKPSNGEFISTMVQVLDLWEGCRDAYIREHRENAMLDSNEK